MGEADDKNSRLDSVFDEVGNFGKFQKLNIALIVIPIFLSGCYTTSYVFSARELNHRCFIESCDKDTNEFNPIWINNSIPLNADGSLEKCVQFEPLNKTGSIESNSYCPGELFNRNKTVQCSHWIYDEYNSIVSEFDLGCEDWKKTLIGTLNSAGTFVAMPLTGILSDAYGRKTIFIAANIAYGVIGTIKALCPNYWSFAFFELLETTFSAGMFAVGLVLVMELVDPTRRTFGSVMINITYGFGSAFLGLIAWMVPYWRTLLLLIYTPLLLVISYYWMISESVRWLFLKGKTKKAIEVLTKAAKMNNKPIPTNSFHELHIAFVRMEKNIQQNKEENVEQNRMIDVMKSKILLVRFIICCFWWMSSTFVYFGMLLNSVSLAGNLYLNYFLVAVIEFPSHIVYYYVIDVIGRKQTLCWSFITTGLACFAFPFISEDMFWIRLITYLFGKFSINIAFSVVYIFTTELFPTPQRNSLLGLCSMFGRFGSIAAPQTPLLSIYSKSLPLILYGITSIISGISVLGFPETTNIKLPDTVEEAENLSKQNPFKAKSNISAELLEKNEVI